MPKTIALRAQILDNLEILEYPNLKQCRFALTWDGRDDGQWTVFLDRADASKGHKILANDYHGKGTTPEEAFKEMLKQTAHQLYLCCL